MARVKLCPFHVIYKSKLISNAQIEMQFIFPIFCLTNITNTDYEIVWTKLKKTNPDEKIFYGPNGIDPNNNTLMHSFLSSTGFHLFFWIHIALNKAWHGNPTIQPNLLHALTFLGWCL